MTWLWVACGSAVGGALRYWCSGFVARTIGETFPWGTLAVNIVGSLLLAVFVAVTSPDGRLLIGPNARQFVALGVFGGFTTFSSFSVQTLTLVQDGEWVRAGANVAASVVFCLIGAWIGFAIGTAINR